MISITTSTPFIGFVDSRKGGRVENQDTCGYADTSFGLLVVRSLIRQSSELRMKQGPGNVSKWLYLEQIAMRHPA